MMKRLFMITYRYRDVSEQSARELTKKFLEIGDAPGVIAHYERLDGNGGFVLQELQEDVKASYEHVLRYSPYMEFEVLPVTTVEDAFPVIQHVFG